MAYTKKYWLQYAATLTVTISFFICGLHFSWTSPTLPKLLADDSPIPITADQGAVLAILPFLSSMFGASFVSVTCDSLGRKVLVLLTCPIYLTAWILIIVSTNFTTLFVARFVVGLADGITLSVVPIYLCEIANCKIRGLLGSLPPIAAVFGILLMNIIGPFLSVPAMASICAVVPIVQFVIFSFMPESPYFYLIHDKTKEAKVSLSRLLGSDDVEYEITELKKGVQRQMNESGRFWDLFVIKSNRKALLIGIGLKTFQQLAGRSIFVVYTQIIFREAGDEISPILSSIIFMSIQLVMCFCTIFTVDKFGRRPFLIWSSIGCATFLCLEGVYFYLKHLSIFDVSKISWLPVVAMLAYNVIFCLGFATIPLLMLGELFSTSIKGYAFGLIYNIDGIIASATILFFQSATSKYGVHVPFFFFGFCTFCCFIFSYIWLPETKGKTLEEIQLWMKGYKQTKIEDTKEKLCNDI